MKRTMLFTAAALMTAGLAAACGPSIKNADSADTKENDNMAKLLYQGHASFKLTLNSGEVIYIDPYAGEGYDDPADLILVTHQHPDHNQTDLPPHADDCIIYQNSDALIDGEYQTFEFKGIQIEAVQAYNRNHDINQCVGYIITVNGKTLYFAGDTSKTEQMEELAERNLDYAFLPIDGKFNMNIPEAIECAELMGAKNNVPIHMSPGELFDEGRAAQFTAPNTLILRPGDILEL